MTKAKRKWPSPEPWLIVACRKDVGLTQAEAGEQVYVAHRTWQDYEAGKRPMNLALFEYWCQKNGVIPAALMLQRLKAEATQKPAKKGRSADRRSSVGRE